MSDSFPYVRRGRTGKVEHFHYDKLFAAIERLQAEGGEDPDLEQLQARTDNRLRDIILCAVFNRIDGQEEGPLEIKLAWEHRQVGGITDPDVPDPFDLLFNAFEPGQPTSEGGDPTDEFFDYALHLTPPYGFMVRTYDTNGRNRYAYIAAPSVHVARIVEVGPGTENVEYRAETIDGSIRTLNLLAPMNRWENLTGSPILYQPAEEADICFIVLSGDQVPDVNIIVFESPMFVECPPALRGRAGLVDVGIFAGVG